MMTPHETYRLTDDDKRLIRLIVIRSGLTTKTAAIRQALRNEVKRLSEQGRGRDDGT